MVWSGVKSRLMVEVIAYCIMHQAGALRAPPDKPLASLDHNLLTISELKKSRLLKYIQKAGVVWCAIEEWCRTFPPPAAIRQERARGKREVWTVCWSTIPA